MTSLPAVNQNIGRFQLFIRLKKTIGISASNLYFNSRMRLVRDIFFFIVIIVGLSFAQGPPSDTVSRIDTLGAIPVIALAANADSVSGNADTMYLNKGDSVYVFDGELFFKARSNGRTFFISQKQLLDKSDSLIVFQLYRLSSGSPSQIATDTLKSKVARRRCVAITQGGTRCRRWAEPASDRCWQHQSK